MCVYSLTALANKQAAYLGRHANDVMLSPAAAMVRKCVKRTLSLSPRNSIKEVRRSGRGQGDAGAKPTGGDQGSERGVAKLPGSMMDDDADCLALDCTTESESEWMLQSSVVILGGVVDEMGGEGREGSRLFGSEVDVPEFRNLRQVSEVRPPCRGRNTRTLGCF